MIYRLLRPEFELKKLLVFLVVYSLLSLNACMESPSGTKEAIIENEPVYIDSTEGKSNVYKNYHLPLPVEACKMLKNKNISYNKTYLLERRIKEKYQTEEKKSLIIGVYSTDLVYNIVYNKNQEVIEYFSVTSDMANKLEITDGYSKKLIDKAANYIDNNDSLNKYAREAYWRTCSFLEKNNKSNILPLIILGSWTESMYYLMEALKTEANVNDLTPEIYTQKENLQNLALYFKEITATEQIDVYKETLKKWSDKLNYLQLEFENIKPSKNKQPGLNEFSKVINAIEQLRAEIISE
ncbi:MAG: hypothetical protein U0W24_21015 [Bacteroidales bacterium]